MRVLMPTTLAEACDMLATTRESLTPIAGGTDLLVHWPVRLDDHERSYLDLSGLKELQSISMSDDWIELGAMTTYFDVVMHPAVARELPLLVTAARQVGAVQIQSRGTWAGNIVNASPAADGVPVLMAYDATVILASKSGDRSVPLSEFYLGYKKMQKSEDELVTAIRIPRRAYDFQVFEKVGPRRAQAITKIGVAMTRAAHENATPWRVVANSMAPTVCRCRAIESLLDERHSISRPSDLLPAILRDVSPIDDIRSTAQYRQQVMARVLYFALREVCEWIQ